MFLVLSFIDVVVDDLIVVDGLFMLLQSTILVSRDMKVA